MASKGTLTLKILTCIRHNVTPYPFHVPSDSPLREEDLICMYVYIYICTHIVYMYMYIYIYTCIYRYAYLLVGEPRNSI